MLDFLDRRLSKGKINAKLDMYYSRKLDDQLATSSRPSEIDCNKFAWLVTASCTCTATQQLVHKWGLAKAGME